MGKVIIIYTDGSCNSKNRLGGYGTLLQFKDGITSISEKRLNGGFSNTTVSRMELLAIIKGLEMIKSRKYPILIISDSQYTINSINKGWVYNWERESFIDRKNGDLWKRFLKILRTFPKPPTFIHTRGHGKGEICFQKGNDIADKLADYKQFEIYQEDETSL